MVLEDLWSILKFTEGLHSDAWDPLGISEPWFPQSVSPLRDLVWMTEVSMNAFLSRGIPRPHDPAAFLPPTTHAADCHSRSASLPRVALGAGPGVREEQGRLIRHISWPDGVHPALGQMSVNGCDDHPVETHYDGPKNRGPQQCMALGKPRLRGSFR